MLVGVIVPIANVASTIDTFPQIADFKTRAEAFDVEVRGVCFRSAMSGHIASQCSVSADKLPRTTPLNTNSNTSTTRTTSSSSYRQERARNNCCYECGGSDHYRAQCPHLRNPVSSAAVSSTSRNLHNTTSSLTTQLQPHHQPLQNANKN